MKTKTCSVCRQQKLADAFFKATKAKDGLMNRCKECEREYRHTHKESKAAANKRWGRSEKGQAYVEKRKQQRQQKAQTAVAALRVRNVIDSSLHARWREQTALRMAMKRKATPAWLDAEHRLRIQAIYAATQQLQEATATTYHVDHIVPLVSSVVCGLHVWWNLRPLTERENTTKLNVFDPLLYPEQGVVAFPAGDGPTVFRKNTQTIGENDDE